VKEPAKENNIETFVNAAQAGNFDEIERLLKNNQQLLNQKNNSGDTALIAAARKGRLGVIKLLIKKGADVEGTNRLGHTVLHRAILSGYPKLVEWLVEEGRADINAVTLKGETVFTLAANKPFIKEFLEKYQQEQAEKSSPRLS
jgi:uncharacterized protein